MTSANYSERLVFTSSLFFKHATQPLWVWYDQFGDQSKKEEISEFTLKLMESGILHEEEYISGLEVSKVEAIQAEQAVEATLELMKNGADLIYQGCVQFEHEGVIYRGRPDLLEKREGKSMFGKWYYAPIEIKWSSKIKPTYKNQLALYSIILERFQGYLPKDVGMINRHHDRLSMVLEEESIPKTRALIQQIIEVMNGNKPDFAITNKSKDSPWFKVALAEAEQKQDIALIYRLDSRSLGALRKEGICTLQDMISANLSALPKIPYASPETLQKAQLQAKSLIDKQVILIGQLDALSEVPLKLYFDIEGDPLLDIDYLFGICVTGDEQYLYAKAEHVRFLEDGKYFVYFLAKQPEEEEAMWKAFLEWIKCLPEEYVVFHYANYEKAHLKSLAEEYGGSVSLEQFQSKLVDLQKVVEKAIIFPLYFYSIKDIAKSSFLNFKWRHQKASGGQSVFWYEQWLETRNNEILEDIINYNEDDVRATECLFLWLNPESNSS